MIRKTSIIAGATLGAWGLASTIAFASPIFEETVPSTVAKTMPALKAALSQHHFKILTRIDILGRVTAKAKQLHLKDFNRGDFSNVTSIIFCNPVFFSRLLNADPAAASVCPLGITLYGLNGKTMIAYPERATMTAGTPALNVAMQIDKSVIAALSSLPDAKPMK